ncbi:ORF99 peptide [Hyphantria cunea nucleopolyhedrovirus]|uniref:ORF99 peptide n=1 Tax=Hyphantria cunea nuclear polyhedrosis virus TaxID=28288 RepID=Q2NP12_NPVHC|nr:ORF99 peptide [Hyphantria cunea nucleopolyhedrovirus]BAE72388.1 ORF99 peptide [Hyphantria cunea nucleopolyhedrovirus]
MRQYHKHVYQTQFDGLLLSNKHYLLRTRFHARQLYCDSFETQIGTSRVTPVSGRNAYMFVVIA